MKKYLAISILLISVVTVQAQKQPASKDTSAPKTVPILKDTSFEKLGVKFGYPENFSVSTTASTDNNMVFYNADSTIILSVSTNGTTFSQATAGWTIEERKALKNNWFKQIGTKRQSHSLSKERVFISNYIYPFNMNGADYFRITLLTVEGQGFPEVEAIKKSFAPVLAPVETKEIIPGMATMEVPVYFLPTSTTGITTFRTNTRLLEVYKTSKKGTNSSIKASDDLKKTGLENGYSVTGNINFRSDSGITFTGFYGRLVRKEGKFYVAHAFFELGPNKECYGIRLRLNKGYSLHLGKDLEALLATIKLK